MKTKITSEEVNGFKETMANVRKLVGELKPEHASLGLRINGLIDEAEKTVNEIKKKESEEKEVLESKDLSEYEKRGYEYNGYNGKGYPCPVCGKQMGNFLSGETKNCISCHTPIWFSMGTPGQWCKMEDRKLLEEVVKKVI